MSAARNTGLAVAALVLIACSKSDAPGAAGDTSAVVAAPAAPTTATPASATPACTLLTPDELSSAAGVSGAEGKPSTSGGADVCTWMAPDGKSVIVQVYSSASDYDSSRRAFQDLYKATAQNVSGIGDAAFYIEGKTGPFQTGTISVKKGASAVSVQVMGGSDPSALKTQATDVAKAVVWKL